MKAIPQTLAALLLILSTGYVSYAVACRLLPRSTVPLRWSGTGIIGMWGLSAFFHLLLPLELFRLPAALAGALLLAVGVWLQGFPPALFLNRVSRDLRWPRRLWGRCRRSAWRWALAAFGFFLVLKSIRVLLLPPLGWDTLTYHGVKAGLWVQGGGPLSLQAPGGWSFYRDYFGGGEIFTAWAMLPFHGDLLATSVDTAHWLLGGLILYALGRQLRLPVRWAVLGVVYVLSLPALHLLIGSGYVEPALHAALLATLLFFIHGLRGGGGGALLVGFMAAGVAVGIKVTALPVAGLFLVGSLLLLFRQGGRALPGWLAAGCLAAVAVTAPWVLSNLHRTGYPLGPVPLEVAGLPLGKANASLEWYGQILDREPYRLDSEYQAARWLFRSPTSVSLHLSALSLVPLGLSVPFLFSWIRREGRVGWALAGYLTAILATFYSPGFSVVRLMFSGFNGRFLVPLMAVVVLLSLGWGRRRGWGVVGYALFLGLGALLHLFSSGFYGWARFEQISVPLAAVLVLGLCSLAGHPRLGRHGRLATMLMLGLLAGAVLDRYKTTVRYRAAALSSVSHPTLKYWARPAALVDEPGRCWRIAMTAGPRQAADNWAMYLFLGRDLQNRLFYIPVARGSLIDFWPAGRRREAARFEVWMEGLQEEGITHVMSFHPLSLEMEWMERHATRFQRLDGAPGVWGFYRLLP